MKHISLVTKKDLYTSIVTYRVGKFKMSIVEGISFLEYDPDGDKITMGTYGAGTMTFSLFDFLERLPQTIEIIRLHYLCSKIHQTRNEKIENLGDYMDKVIDLTTGEARIRKKMEDAAEEGDFKYVKALGEVVKAYLAEKNTVNEFRHAQKFLTNEEGRLLALLAKLEV